MKITSDICRRAAAYPKLVRWSDEDEIFIGSIEGGSIKNRIGFNERTGGHTGGPVFRLGNHVTSGAIASIFPNYANVNSALF